MQDINSNYYHDINATKQNWRVAAWCLKKGIPVDTIDGHPHYKDILFLAKFRDEFELDYKDNVVDYNCVQAYWGIVIKDRKALKPKAFTKFERIAMTCLDHRQQHQTRLNKIYAIRGPRQKQNMDQ
tara:strand:+ start:5463 stop:5840 length:378 start_codon:yes stop_codon:yes gene_type:complete